MSLCVLCGHPTGDQEAERELMATLTQDEAHQLAALQEGKSGG